MDSCVTLEDGERWLPSDIFPEDDNEIIPSRPYDFNGNSMIDLSRGFSMLNFHDRSSEKMQTVPSAPSPNGCYALKVGPSVDYTFFNPSHPGPGPAFSIPTRPSGPTFSPIIAPPVRSQVAEHQVKESSIARNSMTAPLQQNPTVNNNFAFQANANANANANVTSFNASMQRSVAGTGVFIPRPPATSPRYTSVGRKSSGVGGRRMSSNTKTLGIGYPRKINSSKVALPKDEPTK